MKEALPEGGGLHARRKWDSVCKYLFSHIRQEPRQLEPFWCLLKEAIGIDLFGLSL